MDARDESGGMIDAVTDRGDLPAYRLLAAGRRVRRAGQRGERRRVAASAAAGLVPRGSTVVCTVTGHGLKDPEWAISTAPAPTTIQADVLAAARELNLA